MKECAFRIARILFRRFDAQHDLVLAPVRERTSAGAQTNDENEKGWGRAHFALSLSRQTRVLDMDSLASDFSAETEHVLHRSTRAASGSNKSGSNSLDTNEEATEQPRRATFPAPFASMVSSTRRSPLAAISAAAILFISPAFHQRAMSEPPTNNSAADTKAVKSETAIPSDDELRKRLTPLQYAVTRENATERPFNNEYWKHHGEGI